MYAWALVLCVFFALYMFKKSSHPPLETQEELEAILLQLKNRGVESSRDSNDENQKDIHVIESNNKED